LLDIIKKLREKYLVGALTNLTASRRIIDEYIGMYSHFDYVFLSCEEHLKKPDPRFYALALAKADATPEEAIFIDDQKKCTIGAEAIGIKSILYAYPDNEELVENLRRLDVVVDG
jgi:HAD superfamily hydrolase (TIGR01509 family)